MTFTPAGISKTFMQLLSMDLVYSGPVELTQYFVRYWMLTRKIDLTQPTFTLFRQSTMKLGPDNSTVEVEVVLGRRLIGGSSVIYMLSTITF